MAESFDVELARYLDWLATRQSVGSFERVVVSETAMPPTPESVHEPWPPERFAARFDEIVALGTRCWVNLTTSGVDAGGTLHVAVEYFSAPQDGDSRYEAARMFVNYSGLPITGSALAELIERYTVYPEREG